ncbi:MAG: ubiquinone biosynthesis hydroxylase [Methyloligellaceae bacterium]
MTSGRSTPVCDIAIAGGSFAGLSLALALARALEGLRISVIDRTDPGAALSPGFDGRSLALSPASRNLLAALGVWPALADDAQPITAMEITDSRLENVVRPALLHFGEPSPEGEPVAWMVETRHLRRALFEAVAQTPAITFCAPESVAAFHAGDSAIEVSLGSGGTIAAGLLVAADGKKSALRRLAGIRTVGWSYDQVGIAATVAHEKPHHGVAIQHFLPSGPFAILPLTGNRSSLVWTEQTDRGRELVALDDTAFLAELKRRFGSSRGALSLAGPRAAFPLDMHVARSFTAPRLALIGDAAHAVHPLAGQGLNIGLRDVAALTQVVAEGNRIGLSPGDAQLLRRYEQWRRFDSVLSGLAMDGLNRLFSNDNAPLRGLRDIGLGLVERMPALKQAFMQEASGLTGDVPALLRGEMP